MEPYINLFIHWRLLSKIFSLHVYSFFSYQIQHFHRRPFKRFWLVRSCLPFCFCIQFLASEVPSYVSSPLGFSVCQDWFDSFGSSLQVVKSLLTIYLQKGINDSKDLLHQGSWARWSSLGNCGGWDLLLAKISQQGRNSTYSAPRLESQEHDLESNGHDEIPPGLKLPYLQLAS